MSYFKTSEIKLYIPHIHMHAENDTGLFFNSNSMTCFQNVMREMPANQNLTSLTLQFIISLNLVRPACYIVCRKVCSHKDKNQKGCVILPWALSLVNSYLDYTLHKAKNPNKHLLILPE